MKRIDFIPEGVCASRISLWLEEGVIRKAEIEDSCDGNSKALIRLVEGRPAREIVALLTGIDCEGRGTSCPDQLVQALRQELGISE